jgi:hypothetical protein
MKILPSFRSLTLGLAGMVLHCGSFEADPAATSAADGGATDGSVVPPGCDAAADPKDAPACVVDGFGVFVDGARGADSNVGTKAAPFKSIDSAVAAALGRRVHVCEGSYDKVRVSTAVAIYGGFACGTWEYRGTKPEILAPAGSYALEIAKVAGAVVVSDLRFVSASAVVLGGSSIAAFVDESAQVSLVRVALVASDGKAGKDGPPVATGTIVAVSDGALDANGLPANKENAGKQKLCTCSSGATSKGGAGGGPTLDGAPGLPVSGGGAGGTGGVDCSNGGSGKTGSDAEVAANGEAQRGALGSAGWAPGGGRPGVDGAPGQGGGGGGGRVPTLAGAGGACGGCGGTGGRGGQGGGASAALVALGSQVALRESALTTGGGGAGGSGGAGAPGANGGLGGVGTCAGGEGGRGGRGGAGAGGAGGLSVGVLYKGSRPALTATTSANGAAGAKGIGGVPGTNDGPDGVNTEILEAP